MAQLITQREEGGGGFCHRVTCSNTGYLIVKLPGQVPVYIQSKGTRARTGMFYSGRRPVPGWAVVASLESDDF